MRNDDLAARWLRRARLASGRTQTSLAGDAGVPQSVLSAYEHGHRQPSVASFERILRAAGYRLVLRRGIDERRTGTLLPQLLDLADALPRRASGELAFPRLP